MKRSATTGLLLLATAPFASVATSFAPGEPACIAHWRFQDGVRDVAAGQRMVLRDESGHDYHALAIDGPVFRRIEYPGGNLGLEFADGTQRVFVPDDDAFATEGSLTLEAWIRVDRYSDSAAHHSYVLFRGDDRPGFDPWFLAVRDSGQLMFAITDALNRSAAVTSPAPLPLRGIVHVAGTFDADLGVVALFVDGACVATADTAVRPAGRLGGTSPGIGIGGLQSGGGQRFHGVIAEVRISGEALPPERLLVAGRGGHFAARNSTIACTER